MNLTEFSVVSKIYIFGIFPFTVILLLLFYFKFCHFWRAIRDIDTEEKLRKLLLLVPYYIFGLIIILNTTAYCFYVNNVFGFIFFFFSFCLLFDCFDYYKYKIYKTSHRLSGSYLFVRGFSIFIGGYINEMEIFEMVESGVEFPLTYFIYLIIIISIPFLLNFFVPDEIADPNEINKSSLILETNINIGKEA